MRKATARITLRFTPTQLDQVRERIRWTDEPWRGMSHHLRELILEWAGHASREWASHASRRGKRRTV